MDLIYPEGVENLHFYKLEEEVPTDKSKIIWVFPDMEQSFGVVKKPSGHIIIDPSMYYVTSGEAIRKTEVLILDIKERIGEFNDDEGIIAELTDVLISIGVFLDLLVKIKNRSKYLEITKCEDGIYSGNICSRKDPRKKKDAK